MRCRINLALHRPGSGGRTGPVGILSNLRDAERSPHQLPPDFKNSRYRIDLRGLTLDFPDKAIHPGAKIFDKPID